MTEIAIFIAGMVVGALVMFSSFRRMQIAVRNERKRGEQREERISRERDLHQAAAERVRDQLEQLRIDQANSAGYVDGWRACQKEFQDADDLENANSLLRSGLRDGKRIVCGVFDR